MDDAETTAAAIARLSWFDQEDSLCFTLIEGVSEDEVIRRFGGDPAGAELQERDHYWELANAFADRDLPHMLQVGTAASGHVFAVEENGWTGQYVHRGLTGDGGRAVSVYLHVDGADHTIYSVGGRAVVDEEPWGPLTPLSAPEPDPEWDPAWCEGLADEDGWLRGTRQLVMAERIMGVRVEPEWFEMPLRTVLLPEPKRNPMVEQAELGPTA